MVIVVFEVDELGIYKSVFVVSVVDELHDMKDVFSFRYSMVAFQWRKGWKVIRSSLGFCGLVAVGLR